MTPDTKRALLAVTESAARDRLRTILSDLGYTVHEAEDGPSILRTFSEEEPHLVVLSSDLPDGGGIAIHRSIRLLPGENRPTLLVLPELSSQLIGEAGAASIDDFVARPLNPDELRYRIERLAVRTPAPPVPVPAPQRFGDGEIQERINQAILASQNQNLNVGVLSLAVTLDPLPGGPSPGSREHDALETTLIPTVESIYGEMASQGGPGREQLTIGRGADGNVLLVLSHLARLEDTARFGSRMQERLAGLFRHEGVDFTRTVNIGVASFPTDGRDAEEVVRCAETACYCSRQEGGSNIQFYTASMSRWAFERLTLERSLRDAVERGEMEVYYQPRVDIKTRRAVGFEALVRWNHPQLGLVSPAQFIPLAEETGLIIPLGEWVLRAACAQNKAWQTAGLPSVRVSVNLSAAQFTQQDLFETVTRVLEEVGLDPDWLELEVTESMLMKDAESTIETLNRLKSAGIHISIDDFGTGYSSLSYLKRFPIDALKIDRSFIREVTTNPDDAAIATSIILMGHSLRLSVVAEGVEEESQLAFLQVLQCNEIQGYLFSPPVPADRAEAFLREPTLRVA